MASIGHVAVGLAISRAAPPSLKTRVAFAALALLPDADVIAFAFRIPYQDTWGHRGATHSFVFALLIAAVFSFFAKRFDLSHARAFLLAFLALRATASSTP